MRPDLPSPASQLRKRLMRRLRTSFSVRRTHFILHQFNLELLNLGVNLPLPHLWHMMPWGRIISTLPGRTRRRWKERNLQFEDELAKLDCLNDFLIEEMHRWGERWSNCGSSCSAFGLGCQQKNEIPPEKALKVLYRDWRRKMYIVLPCLIWLYLYFYHYYYDYWWNRIETVTICPFARPPDHPNGGRSSRGRTVEFLSTMHDHTLVKSHSLVVVSIMW